MYQLTKGLRPAMDQIAILVNDEVIAYPAVNGTLREHIEISGGFSEKEALQLAEALSDRK